MCLRIITDVLLALNVGNTNVNYAVIDDGNVGESGSMPTPSVADATSVLSELVDRVAPRQIVVASVVPAVSGALHDVAETRGIPLLIADETTIPIEIRVDSPGGVGHDRLVNAYAALRIHGAPAIVVDMGTATTFDVVAADGAFIGGAIAAGAGLGLHALANGTAQLPHVPLVMPESAIGRDTVTAMQSGAVIGHSGLVLILIRAITEQLLAAGSPPPKVILTGGLSSAEWARAIPSVDVIDPYLTLEGLARLHDEVGHPAGVQP
ncbi:MAG TPA: type III pantothenate kinase, partial [Candidatus Limnocylindrales bacterium]|nr:type III pantothenate kinase [Candidatus Limnocylindrales bacterium]